MTISLYFKEDLERFRGDTSAHDFVLTDSNDVALPITGYTFLMTVDTLKDPLDSLTNVFQIAGTITDAAAGEFEFAPTALQADQDPKVKLYYDIQLTDNAGRICTFAKGRYIFIQDITK